MKPSDHNPKGDNVHMAGKSATALDVLIAPAENNRPECATLHLVVNVQTTRLGPIEFNACESVAEWIVSGN